MKNNARDTRMGRLVRINILKKGGHLTGLLHSNIDTRLPRAFMTCRINSAGCDSEVKKEKLT